MNTKRALPLAGLLTAVAIALPAATARAQDPAPAPEAADADAPTLSELLLELGKAQQLANEDPAVGAPKLSAVLEGMHDFPTELAADPAAQAARLEGLLILARARLNLGDEAAASAALDEALRCAHGEALDAGRLGPSLGALETQRREALGAPAPVRVSCSVPCRIYVDERESDPHTQLPTGTYRVFIEAKEADGPAPLDTEIHVEAGAPPVELSFGPAPASEGPELPATGDDPAREGTRQDRPSRGASGRLLPRWAEITGMALGAVAVGTGVALLVLDGRCSDGGSVSGPEACDDLYNTDLPGIVSVGAGGALLLGGGVLLGVDEVRAKRRAEAQLAPSGIRVRF